VTSIKNLSKYNLKRSITINHMITVVNSAALKENGRGNPNSASSVAVFRRSSSSRREKDGDKLRRSTLPDAEDDVGKVFVRRRAASFSYDRTRTRNEASRHERRRMSAFSVQHAPASDELQTRTAEAETGQSDDGRSTASTLTGEGLHE